MPRMTKPDILTEINSFPGREPIEEGKYNELWNLLKLLRAKAIEDKGIPKELYERARKKVGLRDDQIRQYADAEALKKYCDSISPKTNPDAQVKRGTPAKPRVDESMPDKFEIESKMEVNVARNRAQFDEANKQMELRRINRQYRANPVRILTDSCMVPEYGKNKIGQRARLLVTKYTIIMR